MIIQSKNSHQKVKISLLVLLAAILLAACNATPTPTQAPSGLPRFEEEECPFEEPQGQSARCGYLAVLEDRARPASDENTIRLAVAIFQSKAAKPAPDPIVYLEGGPGGSSLRSMIEEFNFIWQPFLAQRDLILFDQRGTGYSEPALDCPEVTQSALDMLPLDLKPAEAEQRTNQALAACRARLDKEGANLAAYTSAANAADLNDLRTALGYKEWNLYGISYGTRLALTEIRDFPQGLRAVVIDSVFPPQVNSDTETPANIERALGLLFDTCAADKACAAAYPNLRQVFLDTVKKLNAAPVKVKINLPDMGLPGTTGKAAEALINGDTLTGTVFQALYITSAIPSLPQIIAETARGNYNPLAELSARFLSQYKDVSYGMNFSVQCGEEVPFQKPEDIAASLKAHPLVGEAFGTAEGSFTACKVWNVPAAAALENQPVKGSVPTLLLAGQFDPVTPPAWAKLASETLSKSYSFEVPFAGHGSSLTEACPRRLALSFIDDPSAAPDSSCLKNEQKLVFNVPLQNVEVELAPFTNSTLGISGVVPANWRTLSGVPGFYSPTGQVTDDIQLLIQGLPVSADQFLQLMSENLKAQGVVLTDTGEKRQAPSGLTYTLYQAGAGLVRVDMALASSGGRSYVVLLQSTLSARDAYYKDVFLPVVDALKPR